MPRQSAGVGKYAIIADDTIVRYVTISLYETIAPYNSFVTVFGATIDGHTLPKGSVVTDLRRGNFPLKLEVLWFQVPSPMTTSRCMVLKGSITTLGAIFASGWIYDKGCIIITYLTLTI